MESQQPQRNNKRPRAETLAGTALDEQIRLLEESLNSDSDSSSTCSSEDEEEEELTGKGPHGEMAVSKAQRTKAVRVSSCFSLDEVAQLLAAHKQLKGRCGVVTKKHGEASSNWNTTFLQTDALFAKHLPQLRKRILDTAAAVDAEQQWGLLSDPSPDVDVPEYALRVVELHTVGPGGSLPERKHYDEGSLVTVDVMLSPPADFDGGQLQTLGTDGEMVDAVFTQGDATVFVSHKYHSVTPVTRGKRQVLVCEVWGGRESCCAHRCEQHQGEFTDSRGVERKLSCPVTVAVSRAATGAHMDGFLDEGAYGHFLNETCVLMQSPRDDQRAEAAGTLARVLELSQACEDGKLSKWHKKEMVALRKHINERAAVRENHFDMDGCEDCEDY